MKNETATQKNKKLQKRPLTPAEIRNRFDEELKRRYWGEKALLDLLPELIKASTSYELATALQNHVTVTEHQIDRLLHVFDLLEERAANLRCEIMSNLLGTAKAALAQKIGFDRDKAIIAAATRIMQHEIAIYEKMLVDADTLGESRAAAYISKSIQEERSAQMILADIEIEAIYSNE